MLVLVLVLVLALTGKLLGVNSSSESSDMLANSPPNCCCSCCSSGNWLYLKGDRTRTGARKGLVGRKFGDCETAAGLGMSGLCDVTTGEDRVPAREKASARTAEGIVVVAVSVDSGEVA